MVKVLLMIFIPMIILIVLLAVFTMIIDKYVTKKALNSSKLYFEKGFNEEYNKHGDTEKFSLFLIKLDKFSYYISFKDEKQNLTSLKEKRDRGEFESEELSSINKFIRCDLKSVLKIKASEVAEYKMSFFMAKPYIKKMLKNKAMNFEYGYLDASYFYFSVENDDVAYVSGVPKNHIPVDILKLFIEYVGNDNANVVVDLYDEANGKSSITVENGKMYVIPSEKDAKKYAVVGNKKEQAKEVLTNFEKNKELWARFEIFPSKADEFFELYEKLEKIIKE